jgi:hypothetical protein
MALVVRLGLKLMESHVDGGVKLLYGTMGPAAAHDRGDRSQRI